MEKEIRGEQGESFMWAEKGGTAVFGYVKSGRAFLSFRGTATLRQFDNLEGGIFARSALLGSSPYSGLPAAQSGWSLSSPALQASRMAGVIEALLRIGARFIRYGGTLLLRLPLSILSGLAGLVMVMVLIRDSLEHCCKGYVETFQKRYSGSAFTEN